MLNQNEENFSSKTKTFFSFWIILIIILILILIIGIIVVNQTNKTKLNSSKNLQNNQAQIQSTVNSYVGKITTINNNNILIKALSDKNYLDKDTTLKITLDEKTQFIALYIPKILKKNVKITKKVIDKNDLKVGQNIVVYSSKNLRNQTSFIAEKIEVHIVK